MLTIIICNNDNNNMLIKVVTIADGDSSWFFEGLVSLHISNLLSTSWKQTQEDCTFGTKMAQQLYWNAAWTTRRDLTNTSYRRSGFCPEAGRKSLWHFPSKPHRCWHRAGPSTPSVWISSGLCVVRDWELLCICRQSEVHNEPAFTGQEQTFTFMAMQWQSLVVKNSSLQVIKTFVIIVIIIKIHELNVQ